MKKETCPFCAHRWIRSSLESPVTCPNCRNKYYNEYELDQLKKKKIQIREE